MIAAAGVSLSKHTMHRTHDREVETLGNPGTVRVEEPCIALTLRCFRYAPFAVGAALIWADLWGVKRKNAFF